MENFNFPLEVIDNNANIFLYDEGSPRRIKDSIYLSLSLSTIASSLFGDDIVEYDEDSNASRTAVGKKGIETPT